MYDTGIFSEFCLWEWDLNTGKWDLGKNWAGKWNWYPPFRTLFLHVGANPAADPRAPSHHDDANYYMSLHLEQQVWFALAYLL